MLYKQLSIDDSDPIFHFIFYYHTWRGGIQTLLYWIGKETEWKFSICSSDLHSNMQRPRFFIFD